MNIACECFGFKQSKKSHCGGASFIRKAIAFVTGARGVTLFCKDTTQLLHHGARKIHWHVWTWVVGLTIQLPWLPSLGYVPTMAYL